MGAQLLVAGIAFVALGALLSARLSARLRAGRLLAGLSPLEPGEALRLAALRGGDLPYVAIRGSIDAAEIFEDENHRPLVYRRERVLIADGSSWREIDRAVRSVEFAISDREAAVVVDAAALDDGLIVIERRWEGTAAELHAAAREYGSGASAQLVADLAAADPSRPALVTLEQVSTLDRAVGGGALRDGRLLAGAGGRPLLLTTLEPGEALRVVGGDRRRTLLLGIAPALLSALGVLLAVAGAAALLAGALEAGTAAGSLPPSPAASAGGEAGDARTGGAGAGPGGLVGLLLALLAPFALGGAIAVAVRAVARSRTARR